MVDLSAHGQTHTPVRGPDLVIAGSARSGTTLLAAQLGVHPRIDPGAVKETNFFSKHYDRGMSWYDEYFTSPRDELVRLDASVSYTYPQYPDALPRLAETSPDATVVYVVRDAVSRAISHYSLNRYYFGHESAPDFGAALRDRSFYAEVSDYGLWISRLLDAFPDRNVIVVPFKAVTDVRLEVAEFVCGQVGLGAPPADEEHVQAHQNNVVTFRSDAVRRWTRRLRHSRAYPQVRRLLGPHTVKRIRAVVTKAPDMPTTEQALATCSPAQLQDLEALRVRAAAAVRARVQAQDVMFGLRWSEYL